MQIARRAMSRWLVLAWLVLGGSIATPAQTPSWQVAQGRVVVVCLLTVGGRFEARTTAVTGQVAFGEGATDLQGSFVVDLRTLDTGIGLRDAHLRDNYFEVSRGAGYEAAVLDGIVLDAPAPPRGRSSTVPFRGVLSLHGRSQPVSGKATVSHKADGIEVRVTFPVRIDAYAIARPTYLGVGVANQVEVSVRATLKPHATTPSS